MDKTIRFHDISRLYAENCWHIDKLCRDVLMTGKVLGGDRAKLLEKQVSQIADRKHAKAVGSCTDALSLCLMGLGIGKGDDVAVSPFTFPASYTCIKRVGANIVWVDIEPDYFMMDVSKIPDTVKAVIVPNMFGQLADKPDVKVPVIEDAAQSITAGTLGTEYMCVSFDPTKILPAFSTGGMVLSDNKNLIERIEYYSYRDHGTNSQLGEVNAAWTWYWAEMYETLERRRQQVAEYYNNELSIVPEVIVPQVKGDKHIYHKYVIKCVRRDNLSSYLLKECGIETKIHYVVHNPLCPVATEVSKQVLSLPMYPTLTLEEQKRIVKCIKRFY